MNSKKDFKNFFNEKNLRPLKGLGQNFLLNKKVLDKIVESAEINPKDVVLEVGPGLGTLTQKLAEKAGLILAIETDGGLVKELKNNLGKNKKVVILEGDILKENLNNLGLKNLNYKLVANIPYYITSKIIKKFLSQEPRPLKLVLMVQLEVAKRIVAKEPHLSILALSVRFFGEPKFIMKVPKNSFWPKPKVDSAIITVDVFDKDVDPKIEGVFFKLVRAGFAKKRKKLTNSLEITLGIPKEEVLKLLEGLGLGKNTRAQEISLSQWIKLTQQLLKTGL
ncbi:ribosomal RNA small subunit methyltransferase A [Candidatus Parcubacteria bacterium]|nr:MAG: ribosomal RNA small subunit methyltransferase A [Candidatus Parcubacteria bacterium]